MEVDFKVIYAYSIHLPTYVKDGITKCMEDMEERGVDIESLEIGRFEDGKLLSCLDREPIYGVREGGRDKEECDYPINYLPIQLFLVDKNVKTNCHDIYGNYDKQVPKVIAKAGLESSSYGADHKFNKHKFNLKFFCADSFNNYAGAGTRLFKAIVETLLRRECYKDIDSDEEDPSASLFSANNSFYDGNPDLFEKESKYSNSVYGIKPEGFKEGTKAGDRKVMYHTWSNDIYDSNAYEAMKGEQEDFENDRNQTWWKRDENRTWTTPDYKRKTPKREREEETDEEEEQVDPNEITSIHHLPPSARVIGRTYNSSDGRVVWDGDEGIPEGMYKQMYDVDGTGYMKNVKGAGYKIKKHTMTQAKKLGVTVKPSTEKNKKIDVHKGGKKIASVGHKDYTDYATLVKTTGKQEADKRREAYKSRHEKTRHKVGSNSYYADKLLW